MSRPCLAPVPVRLVGQMESFSLLLWLDLSVLACGVLQPRRQPTRQAASGVLVEVAPPSPWRALRGPRHLLRVGL